MELLVAYESDPAGFNMATFLSKQMKKDDDGVFHGNNFDLVTIPSPAISADWLEEMPCLEDLQDKWQYHTHIGKNPT